MNDDRGTPRTRGCLIDSITRIAAAGADFATIAANTPHVVFPEVRARSPLPLISIVEVVRDEAQRLGRQRPVLFGSRFTMQGRLFSDVLEPAGVGLVVPSPAECEFIHGEYVSELILGDFRPATRDAILAIARRLIREGGADGLILAGTELPLLIDPGTDIGVPILDANRAHVDAIVDGIPRSRMSAEPSQRECFVLSALPRACTSKGNQTSSQSRNRSRLHHHPGHSVKRPQSDDGVSVK